MKRLSTKLLLALTIASLSACLPIPNQDSYTWNVNNNTSEGMLLFVDGESEFLGSYSTNSGTFDSGNCVTLEAIDEYGTSNEVYVKSGTACSDGYTMNIYSSDLNSNPNDTTNGGNNGGNNNTGPMCLVMYASGLVNTWFGGYTEWRVELVGYGTRYVPIYSALANLGGSVTPDDVDNWRENGICGDSRCAVWSNIPRDTDLTYKIYNGGGSLYDTRTIHTSSGFNNVRTHQVILY